MSYDILATRMGSQQHYELNITYACECSTAYLCAGQHQGSQAHLALEKAFRLMLRVRHELFQR